MPVKRNGATTSWLLYVLPNALFSCATVQHFIGRNAALLYLVCELAAAFVFLQTFPFRSVGRSITSRFHWRHFGTAVLAAMYSLLCLAFLVVYPIDDARKLIGKGNDVDQALTITVSGILAGHFPYYARTYAGNSISDLPGWAMLAIPFLLIFGRVAYLNLAWLAVWFALLRVELKSSLSAAVLGGATFALFPLVTHVFLTGSDHFSSIVAVCLILTIIERAQLLGKRPLWCLGLGLATGVVVSSRMNVLLTVPILAGLLIRRAGWRSGIAYLVSTAAAFGAVTLPWFLMDPGNFTPLYTYDKLGQFDGLLPHLGLVIPLATALLAIWLGLRLTSKGDAALSMAWVLTLPVLAALALNMLRLGSIDFVPSLLLYGVMSTPLWVKAALPSLCALVVNPSVAHGEAVIAGGREPRPLPVIAQAGGRPRAWIGRR